LTWVRNAIVGNAEKGIVDKSYDLAAAT
jgi:hypothetical protein